MSAFLQARGLPYRDPSEKAYSTDANIWGATHEAKSLEELSTTMEIVSPIMGVAHWDPAVEIATEDVTIAFDGGWPVAIDGEQLDQVELVLRANEIGGRHGLGMSDQIENRIIEAKSRGIYEAPGLALLHIAYERLVTAIHNEGTIDNYRTMGRRLGRLLYEGRWFDPQSLMLRESLLRWVGSAVTGIGHAASAPRRRLHDRRHHRARTSRTRPSGCRWSASTDAAFGPLDRIGQLTMRNLDIDDTRAKLDVYRAAGTLGRGGQSELDPIHDRDLACAPHPGKICCQHRMSGRQMRVKALTADTSPVQSERGEQGGEQGGAFGERGNVDPLVIGVGAATDDAEAVERRDAEGRREVAVAAPADADAVHRPDADRLQRPARRRRTTRRSTRPASADGSRPRRPRSSPADRPATSAAISLSTRSASSSEVTRTSTRIVAVAGTTFSAVPAWATVGVTVVPSSGRAIVVIAST